MAILLHGNAKEGDSVLIIQSHRITLKQGCFIMRIFQLYFLSVSLFVLAYLTLKTVITFLVTF